MATKGDNKAQDRRAQRRAMNRYPGSQIGNKVRKIGYGRGLSRDNIRERFGDADRPAEDQRHPLLLDLDEIVDMASGADGGVDFVFFKTFVEDAISKDLDVPFVRQMAQTIRILRQARRKA